MGRQFFRTCRNDRNQLAECDKLISFFHPSMNDVTNDELNFCISCIVCEIKKAILSRAT